MGITSTSRPADTVGQIGEALGSVDGSLALVTGASNGTNTVTLYNPSTLASRGTLTLVDPDLITALSGNFRTDLAGSALVDIQGDVQSIRSGTANGLVLNDTGNLALVKLNRITNSEVVGLPISHLEIKQPVEHHIHLIGARGRPSQRRAGHPVQHPADRPVIAGVQSVLNGLLAIVARLPSQSGRMTSSSTPRVSGRRDSVS